MCGPGMPQVYMVNSTFIRNTADQGGGAVYADTCALIMEDMWFDGNVAGDGFPNDDWCVQWIALHP